MPKVVVLGAGVCGLAGAMMLARDGHDVTVLERDPAPVPETPEAAWERWERRGVAQFRQAHILVARTRRVLEAELPDVRDALVAAGAVRIDPLGRTPPSIADRSPRPHDDELVMLTARRPVVEQVVARAAEEEPGLEVRRGVAAVELDARRIDGATLVTGVRTDAGETLPADLVVDAMGRRSVLPALLAAAGAGEAAIREEAEDCGFLYYTRFFRSSDGTPEIRAPLLTPFAWLSILTLPADAGTWSVTLYISAGDRRLKRVREPGLWTAVVRASPAHAHWTEGNPITGIMPMGGVIDRCRTFAPSGGSVAGVASLADAAACTNPSLGRGISLGLMHAQRLRAVVREHVGDPRRLAAAWREDTERELIPWYRATVAADRARLAEIEAARTGAPPPPPADTAAAVRAALPVAMAHDADVFRAGLEITNCLTLPQEVFARPGLAERVLEIAREHAGAPAGPRMPALDELVTA